MTTSNLQMVCQGPAIFNILWLKTSICWILCLKFGSSCSNNACRGLRHLKWTQPQLGTLRGKIGGYTIKVRLHNLAVLVVCIHLQKWKGWKVFNNTSPNFIGCIKFYQVSALYWALTALGWIVFIVCKQLGLLLISYIVYEWMKSFKLIRIILTINISVKGVIIFSLTSNISYCIFK